MGEMQPESDAQLVLEYAENGSERAFAEIVSRYTNLVYSCAARQVRSRDVAAEITQNVFLGLARGVPALSQKLLENASLAGWLCRTTRNLALNFRRDEFRRQTRERQAMEILQPASETPTDWEQLGPVLDEVMSELSEPDYDALVMRYYEGRDLRAVGLALGVSDDTAQKRVTRALDKLREILSRRGITASAGALAALLTTQAVQSAPAGLVATISAAIALQGAALTTTAATTAATVTAIKTVAMTTLQKTLITAALVTTIGAGLLQTRRVTQVREEMQQQQATFHQQVAELQTENTRLAGLVAQNRDEKSLSQAQMNDLLRLRAQSAQTKTSLQELAKLKAAAGQNENVSMMTNAMAQGLAMVQKFAQKAAFVKLARMKEKLALDDQQTLVISNLMVKQIADQSQRTFDAMSGKQPRELHLAAAQALMNDENDIKAVLTPGQLAAYPEFSQSEAVLAAGSSAKGEVSRLTTEMGLSQEQQDKLYAVIYQLNLAETSASLQSKVESAQALTSYNTADFLNSMVEKKKRAMANKLSAVKDILTPEQLATYQQAQSEEIEQTASNLKMFLPKTNQVGN